MTGTVELHTAMMPPPLNRALRQRAVHELLSAIPVICPFRQAKHECDIRADNSTL